MSIWWLSNANTLALFTSSEVTEHIILTASYHTKLCPKCPAWQQVANPVTLLNTENLHKLFTFCILSGSPPDTKMHMCPKSFVDSWGSELLWDPIRREWGKQKLQSKFHADKKNRPLLFQTFYDASQEETYTIKTIYSFISTILPSQSTLARHHSVIRTWVHWSFSLANILMAWLLCSAVIWTVSNLPSPFNV